MLKALLGTKIGMTQIFDDAGRRVPVTILRLGPCAVTQVKTVETDGVAAVQIGYDEKKRKQVTNPGRGHFAKAGVTPRKVLRDVAPDGEELPEPGREFGVELFEGVDFVDVCGTSKGKGTAGVMKRHGFSGSPETHGGRFGRRGGSIGTSATPSHVRKGTRMSGRMGLDKVTVRNVRVVKLMPEDNLMLVRGSIPGPNGGYVMVRKAVLPPAKAAAGGED
jgi:large subunit ribosomal protein L3